MTKRITNLINQPLTGLFFFWTTSMLANLLNWLYNIQVGRSLEKEDLAILTVFLSLQYLITVPANALTTTVSRFVAYYSEKGEQTKHFFFFRQYWWLSWVLGLSLFALFALFINQIGQFFGIDGRFLILLFSILTTPIFLLAFEKGALSGQLAFSWLGVLAVSEALFKFLFFYLSGGMPFAPLTIAVVSLPISVLGAWFISLLIARSYHPLPVKVSKKTYGEISETYKFLSNSFFAGLGVVLVYSIDVLLVKHFFNGSDAGIYSTLSLLGKVVYFGAGSLIGLLIPLVTRDHAKNLSGKKPFLILISIVGLIGGGIVLAYAFIPHLVIGALLRDKGLETIPYLTKYSSAMLFLVLATAYSAFSLAKKNYFPSRLIIAAAVTESILIWFYHQSISQVVDIVFYTLLTLLITMCLSSLVKQTYKVVSNNFNSLFDLFKVTPTIKEAKAARLLIFNWRDLKHLKSGGAEVYIHELAKRLVNKNYEVTLFTSNDNKNPRFEKIDGVNIIRRGGFVSVYIWAFLYYVFKFKGKYDYIIDSENGIPFFSPLFCRKPVALVVHHVHQDVFLRSLIPPFSWIANFLESYIMPLVYKNSQVIAVSESTASELESNIGFKNTMIISNGVDVKKYVLTKKTNKPQICYVGRLKKYKSVEILLEAFQRLSWEYPEIQLFIAGDGDHKEKLEQKALDLGITQSVKFLGKITESEKVRLLGESWLMVQPSYQEGWGITCLEANACGTPVLASNVSGLKDAVKGGKSGFLFEYGDIHQLYLLLKDLITHKSKRDLLAKTSRQWSENFSWDLQAEKLELVINQKIEKNLSSKVLFNFNDLFKNLSKT